MMRGMLTSYIFCCYFRFLPITDYYMRNIAIVALLFISFSSLSFSAPAQKISEDHFENGEWNGTITYIYCTSSKHAGAYSEYVYKEHDNFSELRMAATISKGKGTATSTYTKREKTVRREKVAGKEYEYEDIHSGTASGSKATELEILLNEEDNTYSINVPTPGYSGSATRTYMCKGCGPDGSLAPKTYEMEGEESLIMVEDQKLGANPNILAGEIVDRSETENGEVFETITRWSFIRGPIDMELIVRLQNYTNWLPVPGKDENTAGDKIQVLLQLQGKDGKEPRLKAKAFELRLVNTSREPGVSINYPIVPTTPAKPDLQFLKQEGAVVESEGQQMRLPAANGKTGTALIGSFDGGGYTVLEVEAILEGSLRVKGHLEVPNGPTEIEVPKRKRDSKIAQAWLDKNGAPGETDDEETSVGNNNNGDGLTAYEEYRGVFSEGKYLRLDPKKKELGVQVNKAESRTFSQGISLFASASGITVIKLNGTELAEDRMINKNTSAGKAGAQYALRLVKGSLGNGVLGENQPVNRTHKTPKESVRTVIDIDQINEGYSLQATAFQQAGIKMPYTVDQEIAATIVHELAHGVNVNHHGERSDEIGRTAYARGRVVYRLFASDGSPITIDPENGYNGYEVKGKVGELNCDASGDLSCVMAYTSAYQWSFIKAADGALEYRAVPPLPQGKHLCTSSAGTGINANGFFGNAKWGNCLSQLKVKNY